MNFPLFLFLFSILGFLCLWIGKKASKGNKNNEDYFLAGRSLKLFPLAMTLLATQLGGGALMGASEEAYLKGWWVLFYPLGMVLGLLILGLGVGSRMRALEIKTVAELFEKKYGSPFLRKLASLLSIVSLFFILTAQAIAAKKFFGSLGISPNILFTFFWLTVVVYTTFGGFKGVVLTDMVQALFILGALGISTLFLFSIDIKNAPLEMVSQTSEGIPWFSWLFAPLLFMLIEQDMGQRCFSAKDGRTISFASISAALLLFLASLIPICFGALARDFGLHFPKGTSALMGSVEALTNPFAASLIAVAILMAIISTVDSLLNSISSNLIFDFPMFQKKPLSFSQGITAFLGVSTFLLSFLFDNVLAMLIFSYQLSISLLFVPVFASLFTKRCNKIACFSSMCGGALAFFFLNKMPYAEFFIILISGSIYASTLFLTKDRIEVKTS